MEYWKAGREVREQMELLIKRHHPHLMCIQDEIAIVFKEKATEKSGLVIPGATKRAPALMQVLTDKKFVYRYIIEIGSNVWQGYTNKQKAALLDHHLCAMSVEEDPNTGELKCGLRPPDFVGYKEEVERHGMWRPMEQDTLAMLESVFGRRGGDKKAPVVRPSDGLLEQLSGLAEED